MDDNIAFEAAEEFRFVRNGAEVEAQRSLVGQLDRGLRLGKVFEIPGRDSSVSVRCDELSGIEETHFMDRIWKGPCLGDFLGFQIDQFGLGFVDDPCSEDPVAFNRECGDISRRWSNLFKKAARLSSPQRAVGSNNNGNVGDSGIASEGDDFVFARELPGV